MMRLDDIPKLFIEFIHIRLSRRDFSLKLAFIPFSGEVSEGMKWLNDAIFYRLLHTVDETFQVKHHQPHPKRNNHLRIVLYMSWMRMEQHLTSTRHWIHKYGLFDKEEAGKSCGCDTV